MDESQESNPYASPVVSAPLGADAGISEAERIRHAHLKHEAEIRAAGWLYYFGAAIVVLFWLLMALRIVPRDSNGPLERMLYGAVYFVLFMASVVVGSGLRRLATWVRWPAGLMSFLGLLLLPAGTIINGYVLYLLFSPKGRTVLGEPYQRIRAETPHVRPGIGMVFWPLFLIAVVLFVPMISFIMVPIILEQLMGP